MLCISLCWRPGPLVRSYYAIAQRYRHLTFFLKNANTKKLYWLELVAIADLDSCIQLEACWRYQAWTIEPTSEVRPYLLGKKTPSRPVFFSDTHVLSHWIHFSKLKNQFKSYIVKPTSMIFCATCWIQYTFFCISCKPEWEGILVYMSALDMQWYWHSVW